MTQAIRSPDASSRPTRAFEKIVAQPGVATEARSHTKPPLVYTFEDRADSKLQTPHHHTAIGDLVAAWEQNPERRGALEDARRWMEETIHADEGDTVRTLRLRKGWSQTKLAEVLGTSQPHIARIERGTENIAIETCRRLCQALDIDMNTLDQALKRQEAVARAKGAR
jgi:ribosome-binding protein aMBF1 (putative translation factor)